MAAQTRLFAPDALPRSSPPRRLRGELGSVLILPGDADRFVVRATSPAGLVVRAPGRVCELSWQRWAALCRAGALLPAHVSDEALGAAVARMRALPAVEAP